MRTISFLLLFPVLLVLNGSFFSFSCPLNQSFLPTASPEFYLFYPVLIWRQKESWKQVSMILLPQHLVSGLENIFYDSSVDQFGFAVLRFGKNVLYSERKQNKTWQWIFSNLGGSMVRDQNGLEPQLWDSQCCSYLFFILWVTDRMQMNFWYGKQVTWGKPELMRRSQSSLCH